MSLIYINNITAFTVSLLGLLLYLSHLMTPLLCLEGMMLYIFMMASVMILSTHMILASMMSIVLLVFTACEAALELSLLVMVSNTYGMDHVQNLSLLQCQQQY